MISQYLKIICHETLKGRQIDHETLKGRQIDHKSAPFVNDKIAKNPVLIGPGEHHAATRRPQKSHGRGQIKKLHKMLSFGAALVGQGSTFVVNLPSF